MATLKSLQSVKCIGHAFKCINAWRLINNSGGKAVALKFDSAKIGSINDFVGQVSQVLKKEWYRENFDYLVNNAGIAQQTLIKDRTERF
jgi:hypothetical protein